MNTYKRPPIIEAAIEIRFSDQLSEKEVDKLAKQLKPLYPLETPEIGLEVMLHMSSGVTQSLNKETKLGYKLQKDNFEELLLIHIGKVAVLRQAPYPNWDTFLESFKTVWSALYKTSGFRKISRIGLRYINRIDVPISDNTDLINISDFLTIGIDCPEKLHLDGYQASMLINSYSGNIGVSIRTATVASPLANHASILLDQDLFVEVDLPQKSDGIIEKLNEMRVIKNDIFESTITDKSRALFNREIV